MIDILKASAGSGKTYALTKKYIGLLLKSKDRYPYRHILAVTFTNKATDEMKRRILKELNVLAVNPEASPYYKDFVTDFSNSGDKLKCRAGDLLFNILHDYSAFAVSTIDKFFQLALKAFSREIGQFASYQVELDKNSLVRESVDRVLDSLTEDKKNESRNKLLKWLIDSVKEELEQDGRVNLESKLYDTAEKLKSEEYREITLRNEIEENIYSEENLKELQSVCEKVIKDFETRVRNSAKKIVDIFSNAGIPLVETNRKFLNFINVYTSGNVEITGLTDSFLTKAYDSSQWFSQKKSEQYLHLLEGVLNEPLIQFCQLFDRPFKVYNTAKIIKSQLSWLRIAGELEQSFSELQKDKNVLSLEDSNVILKNIIDGADAPFIYEKLGVRFEHFLLDEFQDTSSIQWKNFYPLLKESNAGGNDNLIVGDVKQSIYRWRGADWDLLASGVKHDFPDAVENNTKDNWRSLKNIVEFNNDFFLFAASVLDQKYGDTEISDIYKTAAQNVKSSDKSEGLVCASFCETEKENEQILKSVLAAKEAGAYNDDIAILVRNNKQGSDIASFLIANDINVISDDSLQVKSSLTVRRLVALLSYSENPSDKITGFIAQEINAGEISESLDYHSLIDLCEILLRELRAYDSKTYDKETLYIQSFMDTVLDWTSANGNNLLDFLKYWADVDPKISSPEDSDAVRVMTIHKSKGLEFPYVIFPYSEKVTLVKPDDHWSYPQVQDTDFQESPKAVYIVRFSESTSDTLFDKDYEKNKKLSYIDNINTFYVALTRAVKCLHIISSAPPKNGIKAVSNFSQILYLYLEQDASHKGFTKHREDDGTEKYILGKMYDFKEMTRDKLEDITPCESLYRSYILNNITFNSDASDFFSEDGKAGIDASQRLKGIVIHNILSKIVRPQDLANAVEDAYMSGEIGGEEKRRIYELLSERIKSACERGWFPAEGEGVRNEVELFDIDGSVLRPDRVIINDDSVKVIDYKFGERNNKYRRQVQRYADIYSRIGYKNVETFIWYVREDVVE